MKELIVSYNVWTQIADAHTDWSKYYAPKGDGYIIATGHSDLQFVSSALTEEDRTNFETTYVEDSTAVSSKEDAVALLVGINTEAARKTSKGSTIVQSDAREGSKVQVISQNFCDKNTWYTTSVRRTAQAMETNDGYTYQLEDGYKFGVDVLHGRLLHERDLRASYAPIVKVNGAAKVEVDPHTGDGDFTIDYDTMIVTFAQSQVGNTVTLDFSEVINSKWYVTPADDKCLRLIEAELNFSRKGRLLDTIVFAIQADVAKHPLLAAYWNGNGGPFPAGTYLPLRTLYYQTINDLIFEANKSFPVINKSVVSEGSEELGWRDLHDDMDVYAWDYANQATIDLHSDLGMRLEICLEHDLECFGKSAVVSFYCVSEEE
jgi:hypothetical protein